MNLKKYNSDYYSPMFFKKKTPLFAAFLLFVGCSSALKIPSGEDAVKSGTSLDTLLEGRKLYISSCSSCHNLFLPEKFTHREWEKNVEEMQEKAKINDIQKELILKYLKSQSKDGLTR